MNDGHTGVESTSSDAPPSRTTAAQTSPTDTRPAKTRPIKTRAAGGRRADSPRRTMSLLNTCLSEYRRGNPAAETLWSALQGLHAGVPPRARSTT